MSAAGSAYGCRCCCCFVGWILRMNIAILVLFGVAVLFFFIIVNPQNMKVRITDASLTKFNFNEANETIHYNLNFTISIRNPNRIIGFYYDDFSMWADYQNNYTIDSWWMRFYQGRKNTALLSLKFEGKKELYFVEETDERSRFTAKFEEQKRDHGIFDIEVKADLLVGVKLGRIRIGIFQPEIRCGLVVPLITTGKGKSATGSFNSTECGVQFKADSLFEPLD